MAFAVQGVHTINIHISASDPQKIIDGRRSFPSGHSSTAFSGMMFLSLWIAGMTGAWCLSQSTSGGSFLRSKLARLSLSLAPLAFATWVAVSRLEDYVSSNLILRHPVSSRTHAQRHHKEDVIVGSLIGIFSATVCYLIYWPSPLSIEPHTARAVYGSSDTRPHRYGTDHPTRYGYELTGMENEHAEQRV